MGRKAFVNALCRKWKLQDPVSQSSNLAASLPNFADMNNNSTMTTEDTIDTTSGQIAGGNSEDPGSISVGQSSPKILRRALSTHGISSLSRDGVHVTKCSFRKLLTGKSVKVHKKLVVVNLIFPGRKKEQKTHREPKQ